MVNWNIGISTLHTPDPSKQPNQMHQKPQMMCSVYVTIRLFLKSDIWLRLFQGVSSQQILVHKFSYTMVV